MPPIPPGGFAGFAQMTPASRIALTGNGPRGPRRRKAKAKAKRTKVRAKRRAGGTRKMKFGSPAWQKKYRVGKFAKK